MSLKGRLKDENRYLKHTEQNLTGLQKVSKKIGWMDGWMTELNLKTWKSRSDVKNRLV